MQENRENYEIKPVSVRQLALALLFALIISSLIALIIIRKSNSAEFQVYHGEIPNVIKHKASEVKSAPRLQTMSFTLPS